MVLQPKTILKSSKWIRTSQKLNFVLVLGKLLLKSYFFRAVHHGPRTQHRSNQTEYRIGRIEIRKNFSYGPKIATMARILTIFGRNRSSRCNLSFQKLSNERKIIESIGSIDWIGRSIDRIDRWPPCFERKRQAQLYALKLSEFAKRLQCRHKNKERSQILTDQN